MVSFLTVIFANLFLWLWGIAAAFLWWATRGNLRARRASIVLLGLGWLLGLRPVAETFMWPLESRYTTPSVAELREKGVKRVVVLTGGGWAPRSPETLVSSLPHGSAYRFWSGVEVCSRLGPDCEMVFSGSAGRSNTSVATALNMRDLETVVQPARVTQAEAKTNSTDEHPGNVGPLVAGAPFAVVTSAYHMPRVMRVFRKAGLTPVPYPVDYLRMGHYGLGDVLPSINSLELESDALREYLALTYYVLRGK